MNRHQRERDEAIRSKPGKWWGYAATTSDFYGRPAIRHYHVGDDRRALCGAWFQRQHRPGSQFRGVPQCRTCESIVDRATR